MRFRKNWGRVWPEDTPAAAAWRQRDNAFRAQAAQEQREKFAPLTVENFQEACDWFNARVAELHREEAHALCGCMADEFGRPVRTYCEQHGEG